MTPTARRRNRSCAAASTPFHRVWGRRQLDDAELRPLIDEFLHGANGVDAEARAALFRLAWDFVGSGLGGRNLLYERFYLASAGRNRITAHVTNADRSRAYGLVEGILAE